MTEQDATPKLVDAFCVHGGELSSWAPPEIFELGAEWGRILELLRAGERFKMVINGKNLHRVLALGPQLDRDVHCYPVKKGDWTRMWLLAR